MKLKPKLSETCLQYFERAIAISKERGGISIVVEWNGTSIRLDHHDSAWSGLTILGMQRELDQAGVMR